MADKKGKAIIFAFLAAVFYALNVPLSKIFLQYVNPVTMAALLYLGAGIGIGIIALFGTRKEKQPERLTKGDLPFVIGMIILDIAAPIFLMLGIRYGSPANVSLVGNFEIVATTIIALFVFKETVTSRLWAAIVLITFSTILLSFEGADSFHFSYGSLFVVLATICWGIENNCTRSISSKNTYEIVVLKGVFSGLGSLMIAFVMHEEIPKVKYILAAMLLGFFAYGFSIFMYVRAQNVLGAAKTSAYYAVAPFVGSFLSYLFFKETLSWTYLAALAVMITGTLLVVLDTLTRQHTHEHQHTFTYLQNGTLQVCTITHNHAHNHYGNESSHRHHHVKEFPLEKQ